MIIDLTIKSINDIIINQSRTLTCKRKPYSKRHYHLPYDSQFFVLFCFLICFIYLFIYLLFFTSSTFMFSLFFITEPGVTVACGKNNMTVALDKQTFPFFEVSKLHLRYSSCRYST